MMAKSRNPAQIKRTVVSRSMSGSLWYAAAACDGRAGRSGGAAAHTAAGPSRAGRAGDGMIPGTQRRKLAPRGGAWEGGNMPRTCRARGRSGAVGGSSAMATGGCGRRGRRLTAMPLAAWPASGAWRCRCLLAWRRGAATADDMASAPVTRMGTGSQPRRGNGAWRPPETSSRTASAVLMPQDIQKDGQERCADRMTGAFSVAARTRREGGPQLSIWSTLQGAVSLVNTAVGNHARSPV